MQSVCWFGVINQLTSNYMFGLGNVWTKITLVIFENFEIALVLPRQFQNFQKCTRAIHPKLPSRTCDYYTNSTIIRIIAIL